MKVTTKENLYLGRNEYENHAQSGIIVEILRIVLKLAKQSEIKSVAQLVVRQQADSKLRVARDYSDKNKKRE